MASYSFTLYVTGSSVRSEMAIANLRRICERQLAGDAAIEVIDVLAQPARAEQARILTTPTLVSKGPGPEVRITGDLGDEAAVLHALGIPPG